jgi:phosphoglycerate dehydrogenase-like enzyme
MEEFLGESDYVLLTLPTTSQTTNLVNRDAFKAMKKSAYLINICRGLVVEERDLVEALKGNELAGAILDVVKEEPLHPDSKLWDCPNLIISPHISGPSVREDMIEFFKENFRRSFRKQPLVGLVDFERGY